MLEFLKGLLSGNQGTILQVVSIGLLVNGVLSGVKVSLDAIKDKTANVVDNKIADALGSMLSVVSKILDFLQGNVKH